MVVLALVPLARSTSHGDGRASAAAFPIARCSIACADELGELQTRVAGDGWTDDDGGAARWRLMRVIAAAAIDHPISQKALRRRRGARRAGCASSTDWSSRRSVTVSSPVTADDLARAPTHADDASRRRGSSSSKVCSRRSRADQRAVSQGAGARCRDARRSRPPCDQRGQGRWRTSAARVEAAMGATLTRDRRRPGRRVARCCDCREPAVLAARCRAARADRARRRRRCSCCWSRAAISREARPPSRRRCPPSCAAGRNRGWRGRGTFRSVLFVAGLPFAVLAVADPYSSLVAENVTYPGRRIA